jgi:hypothetical protein
MQGWPLASVPPCQLMIWGNERSGEIAGLCAENRSGIFNCDSDLASSSDVPPFFVPLKAKL